jgi:three-Cys-motif partner protein
VSERINEKNMVCEPQAEWGGSWTNKKLDAFGKYVSAYLTIMRKNPYWETAYFDGFAGCGDRKNSTNTELYQELLITDEEESLYQGAAERVLDLKNGLSFSYYYFIDTDSESLDKLKAKLSKFQNDRKPFQFRQGDCNEHISALAKAMKDPSKKLASLVLIDPFGMHIDWKSIEELKDTKTDIWILIPTGVIVNRLLDKKGELTNFHKLESFFGLSIDEIKEIFYKTKIEETLFGVSETTAKINKPIEKIAELYTERLKTIWNYVIEKPLMLENSRGVPIFHFVFASNNETARKIASQIIDKAH